MMGSSALSDTLESAEVPMTSDPAPMFNCHLGNADLSIW